MYKIALLLLFGTSCFAIRMFQFNQDDYDLNVEIIDWNYANPKYLSNVKAGVYRYNRTIPYKLLNVSGNLLVDINHDFVVHTRGYKFISNEYRPFPVDVMYNLCDLFAQNAFNWRGTTEKYSNIRGCPAKKGFYYLKDYPVRGKDYPPLIPEGKYKAVIRTYYDGHFIASGSVFFTVTTKIKRWE